MRVFDYVGLLFGFFIAYLTISVRSEESNQFDCSSILSNPSELSTFEEVQFCIEIRNKK